MNNDQHDFWGDQADWQPGTADRIEARRFGNRLRGFWNAALNSGTTARRVHGESTSEVPVVRPETLGELVDATPASDLDEDRPAPVAEVPLVDARIPRREDRLDDTDAPAPDDRPADDGSVDVPADDGWGDDAWSGDGWGDDVGDGDWNDADVPATAWTEADWVERDSGDTTSRLPSGAVDPLLARMGAIAIVVTLLVPVFLGLRSGGDGGVIETSAAATTTTPIVLPVAPDQATDEAPVGEPAAGEPRAADEPVASAPDEPTTEPAAETTVAVTEAAREAGNRESDGGGGAAIEAPASEPAVTDAAESSSQSVDQPATADAEATRIEQVCAIDYEVVEGDFWIRLADGAGVPLTELLEANAATVDTPLFAGTTICLPAGSSIPEPPPVTVAADEESTAIAAEATTTTTTTTTSTTTTTTTVPASNDPQSPEEVQALIREIWPDELEERALEIAFIESRYDPRADNNFCCYGVFQIYWEVHQGWLADLGVTSLDQLFDAETNIRAAYTLYQRAGGWGPWGG